MRYLLIAIGTCLLAGCRPQEPAPLQFQWTRRPTPEMIPADPLQGQAVGRPFSAREVRFEGSPTGWRMVVSGAPGEGFLVVDLPGTPKAGRRWLRPMAYGGGYWQVGSPEDPAKLVTWTSENAWVLEIRSWRARPWRADGLPDQLAGRASGRFAICYEGALGGFGNSFVAGDFKGAAVRYLGRPAGGS